MAKRMTKGVYYASLICYGLLVVLTWWEGYPGVGVATAIAWVMVLVLQRPRPSRQVPIDASGTPANST